MWDAREEAQLPIFPSADLRPSRVFPPRLPPGQTPDAPELRQPEDGDLPALNPRVGRRARTRARARGGAPRGGPGDEAPDDPPTPHEHPVDPRAQCTVILLRVCHHSPHSPPKRLGVHLQVLVVTSLGRLHRPIWHSSLGMDTW
ncbi:hypothetical protein PIB30_059900 [Stylosanthes scabra]|uniref:Uncharacterized protein n=1 Tax=Stylosanthes scabra TaxID=79078 RepID=A0ABU6QK17_9FABA|nr:hypothetical protein [Stylosanthes scabra]